MPTGSIGNCHDNVMIESFWGRMQTELTAKDTSELANAICEYLRIPTAMPNFVIYFFVVSGLLLVVGATN
ncbi:transposase InsO family protein [Mycobacterium sp. OTB74]|nr:transposase InsO family protein [Mycobacterium sp. OTB74]